MAWLYTLWPGQTAAKGCAYEYHKIEIWKTFPTWLSFFTGVRFTKYCKNTHDSCEGLNLSDSFMVLACPFGRILLEYDSPKLGYLEQWYTWRLSGHVINDLFEQG